MAEATVETQCSACAGTGVYCGFAEPKGTGVVCLKCNGSGMKIVTYIPFTGRQSRSDVQIVRLSCGNFIGTGVGPVGTSVTYEEFLQGKMPTDE